MSITLDENTIYGYEKWLKKQDESKKKQLKMVYDPKALMNYLSVRQVWATSKIAMIEDLKI